MSVAPINKVLLSDALLLAQVAEGLLVLSSPLLSMAGYADKLIHHRVISKTGRMHQEWPEFGRLYCALLWQATGYTYVNSPEIKKQCLPGILVIREVNGVPSCKVTLLSVFMSIYLVVNAGKSIYVDSYCGAATQLYLSPLLMQFAYSFQMSENLSMYSLGAVLSYWCCSNRFSEESK